MISGATENLYKPDWQPLPLAPAPSPSPTPSPLPTPSPSPADTRAPAVTLAAPRTESVRRARLHLLATSDEAATAIARGKLSIRALGKRYRLRPATTPLTAGNAMKLRLKIRRKPLHAIRAALAARRRVTAGIVVSVRDGAGNVTTKSRKVRLKR